MEQKIVDALLKYRYWLSLFSILSVMLIAMGAKNLYQESDYRIFFLDSNPQLQAFDSMQENYTKTDALAILIKPDNGDVFTVENLALIKDVTDDAWQSPFSIRVDSITNYQHSWAEGDDLMVDDLVPDIDALDAEELARIKEIALNEKQLFNRVISRDASTTLVNITLELPPSADSNADKATQAQQRLARDAAFPEIVGHGNAVRDKILQQYPDFEVHFLGVPIINQSFNDSGVKDSSTIIPLMYAVIIAALAICLRSVGSIVGVIAVISLATLGALGSAGWMGIALNGVNLSAPVIILTIAVCDSVHLLVIYLRHLAQGETPLEAMRESLLLNLQPIVLTSVTTAIGFATLNFSESPPFVDLGNMSALGVMYAMVLTFALLPALSMLLVRRRKLVQRNEFITEKFANFVIGNSRAIFIGTVVVAITLVAQMPRNHIDDDPITYFKPGVPYRDAAIFSQTTLPGIKNVEFSISCGEAGCVSDPEYLHVLNDFGLWVEQQEGVEFVATYIDVIKRLNRNMNAGDEAFYAIPDTKELAAQYQLLYELSLPYGLDLNNMVNFDMSATKTSVFTRQITTGDFIDFETRAQEWFAEYYPTGASRGASVHTMFANLGERNIRSMSIGAIIALVCVTLTILIALRSIKWGMISLLPNAFPCMIAFGIWGLTVAQVSMAVAVVFSVTLGIVVDDTVHFISKYRRAREGRGYSPEDAMRYAFSTVGGALIITTVVLAIGFALLMLSDFNLNSHMGALTATTIVVAIIFDFLMLPTLLLMLERRRTAANRGTQQTT